MKRAPSKNNIWEGIDPSNPKWNHFSPQKNPHNEKEEENNKVTGMLLYPGPRTTTKTSYTLKRGKDLSFRIRHTFDQEGPCDYAVITPVRRDSLRATKVEGGELGKDRDPHKEDDSRPRTLGQG